MNIKHLQLNTSALKNPEKVADYIKKQNIDIACLQEIIYPRSGTNPLRTLLEKDGYHYFEGIHFYYKDKNLSVGNAVISKYPITDFYTLYFNTPNFQPNEIGENDFVGAQLLEDDDIVEDMASRGLKHSIKSRSIPIVTITVNKTPIRVYSIQFTVSSWATETEQMYKMSQLLVSSLKYSKDIPTIVSGDFNVKSSSYSVELLKKYLKYDSKELKNTLSDSHRALEKDFPNGLAVDHIFSKGLKHISTNCFQIEFSDHKALISEFEIS